MNKKFIHPIQIRFHEADPAGILYFANVFTLAHSSFEEFVEHSGITWERWFKKYTHFVPIRHAECDYKIPFRPGEKYEIECVVSKISESSFQMTYTFKKDSHCHAIVKMVHTFIDKTTLTKTSIPDDVRKILKEYLKHE